MSISPDYVPYADMTLYDKSPSDILAAAVSTLQSRWPDWNPAATNVEMAVLEALAIEVGETVFTINRLPDAMVYYLMSLYGVERYSGAAPSVEVEFTAQDDAGYVVPAGTEVSLLIPNGEYMSFYTVIDLTIPAPETKATVVATATDYTNIANGVASGTEAILINSLTGIESAITVSDVYGGDVPESDELFRQRGIQRLQRLVDTLVTAEHFTQAALENPEVVRATAIDNFNANDVGDPGDHPGFVTVVVYGDGYELSDETKTALEESLESRAAVNLDVVVTDPTITPIDITVEIVPVAGYTSTAVISAVETRLNEYLSVYNWDWAGTVRRNELISIIDQVPGVDYVAALTSPASDITLSGVDTLVSAGALDVSVEGEGMVFTTATASLVVEVEDIPE